MLHRIFLFAHVVSAFLYLLAHGTSVGVAFRIRRESSADRVRALLDVSWSTVAIANYMFISTVVCGVVLGFLGHWWSARWIWLSIAILLVILVVMGRTAGSYFRRIRSAVGLAFVDGTWQHTARELSADELARVLASGNAVAVTGIAVVGWALIVWLMLFKP